MMAGTYLDGHSERRLAAAQVADARPARAADPEPALSSVAVQVRAAGFTSDETDAVVAGLRRNPEALLSYIAAFELGVPMRTESSPRAHALWMFVADLFAASVPVVPFVLFPIDTARIVSLLVTGALMAALGVARALIGHESVYRTALQTMGIAGAAALAGVFIGRLVTA
jgi:VIT1/CCC1 family predicted Fe2+/Mn2+ transporter